MKSIGLISIVAQIITLNAFYAQNYQWKDYTISCDSIEDVRVHVLKNINEDKRKPLLLYLQGSGNYPLFFIDKGRLNTSVTIDTEKYAKDFHIALISKPGIPFKDSLSYYSSGQSYYPINEVYKRNYSLDWRVNSASLAIDYLSKKIQIDKNKTIVMGHSEGAQIAPAVAVKNSKVTHCIQMMANALNHFYDFILEARMKVEKKEISANRGEKIVDSLYTVYQNISSKPLSTDDYWYGETFKKWSSFTSQTPLQSMLKLDIPILYIAGGKDNNQTILGMDYAKLEFLRKGKTNLTYKVYPNYNHYFQEYSNKNGETNYIEHIEEVHEFAIDWVGKN